MTPNTAAILKYIKSNPKLRRLAVVATRLGAPYDKAKVSRTLNGKRKLSVDEILPFAKALDMPPLVFLHYMGLDI